LQTYRNNYIYPTTPDEQKQLDIWLAETDEMLKQEDIVKVIVSFCISIAKGWSFKFSAIASPCLDFSFQTTPHCTRALSR
jgi:hypothetical protein